MGRVYVVGSINQDIVVTTDRHPKPGETLHGQTLKYFPGGKGANQAVAAARAGAETTMVGSIGADSSGAELKEFLKECGVQTDSIKSVSDSPTGTAIITVAKGDNTIVVVAGANSRLSSQDTETLDLKSADIVLAQFETPATVTETTFKKAKQVGATTILNPAPAAEVQDNLLCNTDYLIVNEHEFEIIFRHQPEEVLSDFAVWDNIAGDFKGTIIVTLGEEGCLLWSANDRIRLEGIKVKSIDSTGAGDCFAGYFAGGMAVGEDVAQALRSANSAAAISVTKLGAASSIPLKSEI